MNLAEPHWLIGAREYLGKEELPGMPTASFIERWLQLLGAWWKDDETPWCGTAVAAWMRDCGIEIPRHWYRARAWLDWGVPVAPVVGSVIVFERAGGGHVGLLVGKDEAGRLLVLGGNQGNKVSIAPFDQKRMIGCRWPKEWTYIIPPAEQLPVLSSAGASSSNEA